jgi:2'-5' RNA ligase
MIRLFVGLELPDRVKGAIEALRGGLPDARWIEPANMHLTLRFIGEVAEDEAEELELVLRNISSPSFEMELAGVDCFHSRGRVRSVWTGAVAGPELDGLRGRTESALVRAGLPPEGRKFTPHVTIARLRQTPIAKVRPYLEMNTAFRCTPFALDSFQLFRSHLGHGGARYEVIADYCLAAKTGQDAVD